MRFNIGRILHINLTPFAILGAAFTKYLVDHGVPKTKDEWIVAAAAAAVAVFTGAGAQKYDPAKAGESP